MAESTSLNTKKPGWHSRRHQDAQAHTTARDEWDTFKSADGKRATAAMRAQERTGRSHREQITLLDQRLGLGQGAAKERARLQILIDAEVAAAQVQPKTKLTVEEKAEKKATTAKAKAAKKGKAS
jgi:hypothetical protein